MISDRVVEPSPVCLHTRCKIIECLFKRFPIRFTFRLQILHGGDQSIVHLLVVPIRMRALVVQYTDLINCIF